MAKLSKLLSATPWYIVSNAAEHMTGNLHLLTNFTPTQPGRLVRTHTGAMLQVRGKGSLTNAQFAVPGVNYVPGLAENIISVTQLTDSGFSVVLGPGGCTVTRNHDGERVGGALHAGGQLYRLHYLRVTPSNATPWYIVSNAAEHMTGNLYLLTNFTPTRPPGNAGGQMYQLDHLEVAASR